MDRGNNLLLAQEHKGYGEDEGERAAALDAEIEREQLTEAKLEETRAGDESQWDEAGVEAD
jgi:hypothetical protein